MSEPKVLYVQRPVSGGVWDFQPADDLEVLAVVRRGVESGTIKGEARKWCTVHRYTESHLYGEECEYAYHHRPSTLCRFVESTIIIGPVSDGGSET